MRVKHVAWLAVLACTLQNAEARIVTISLLARHGNRAPNNVTAFCPNHKSNMQQYDVGYGGLTGKGMEQLLELGQDVRKEYVFEQNLLDANYTEEDEVMLRTSFSSRVVQSAFAFSMGLYPNGTGPRHYCHKLPPPLPIKTVPEKLDSVLEARKSICKAAIRQNQARWREERGKYYLEGHTDLLKKVSKICGADILTAGKDPYSSIKDVADAFVFDKLEGLPPLEGLDEETFWGIYKLSQDILLDRDFSTPLSNLFFVGDLANHILSTMHIYTEPQRENGQEGPARPELSAYFAHREVHYGFVGFMGLPKIVYHHNHPAGALPPGVTFVWELHQNDTTKEFFVRFRTYVPCKHQGPFDSLHNIGIGEGPYGKYEKPDPTGDPNVSFNNVKDEEGGEDIENRRNGTKVKCGWVLVKIPACSTEDCSFNEFERIFKAYDTGHGDWREKCKAAQKESKRIQTPENGVFTEEEEEKGDEDEGGFNNNAYGIPKGLTIPVDPESSEKRLVRMDILMAYLVGFMGIAFAFFAYELGRRRARRELAITNEGLGVEYGSF